MDILSGSPVRQNKINEGKMKNQIRSYKIKKYWTDDEIVGGEKPGRYFQTAKKYKKGVRLNSKKRSLVSNYKLCKRILNEGLIITFTILMLLCAFQVGIKKEDISVEAQIPALTEAGNFESKEIPAYEDAYDEYFGNKADEARKVAKCESGDRDIKSKMNDNGTYDYGRMQVNTIWLKFYKVSQEDLLNKDINIKVAKMVYDRRGNWSAWSSSSKCHGLE
jgi:hypothetical protein